MINDRFANTKSQPAFMQVLKNELGGGGQLREGIVVKTTLLKKTSRAAFFSIGKFATGVVYGVELQESRDIIKKLEIGDTINARVERLDGYMGFTELSLSEADKQRSWQEVKALEESGETVDVKITGANQGGLLANFMGLKAFLPISRLSNEHTPKEIANDRQKIVAELEQWIGQTFTVKIITVIPKNNKLVLSEREASLSDKNVEHLLEKYNVGDVVEAVVSGIADFGVFVQFVDHPEVEGLIHISEIDHRIIDSPKEVLHLGKNLQVKIIEKKGGRVYLSLKALKEDPWEKVHELFKENKEVSGSVYKFNPFGAVIDLDHGLQGLIHVSEFGGSLDEMKKVLNFDTSYSFIVVSIKPEEKRIILKYKD